MIKYDLAQMDTTRIMDFIFGTYWGGSLNATDLERAFGRSYCAGLFKDDHQIGFARAVSDGYTCAHIADFLILEGHQRQGHGAELWKGLCGHPDLTDVRRWYLGTKDAHGFYEKHGFQRSPDGIHMHFNRQ